MSEKPILFSGPMVRGIIDEIKTQTRRAIKPQPQTAQMISEDMASLCYPGMLHRLCPFGGPGDRLWIREKIAVVDAAGFAESREGSVVYAADATTSKHLKFKPSIHMPRWVSRLTLEITNVKVERLQDISEEDAKAEGVRCGMEEQLAAKILRDKGYAGATPARLSYGELWDSINGPGSWNLNPWIWKISFRKL